MLRGLLLSPFAGRAVGRAGMLSHAHPATHARSMASKHGGRKKIKPWEEVERPEGRKMKRKERRVEETPARRPVHLRGPISAKNLAVRMGRPVSDLTKPLSDLGIELSSPHNRIPMEVAELVAQECGHPVVKHTAEEAESDAEEAEDPPAAAEGEEEFHMSDLVDEHDKSLFPPVPAELKLSPRPPVVTIMGHVDHGKTSLLDALRSSSVAEGEAGGITQHVGAFEVNLKGQKVTFLDTPGHAAFSAMRARGANVTDIVIIVVAADEGVKPQTVEAIKHAQSADVPIIVAFNKCDRPGANPDRVAEELLSHDIVTESMGGDVQSVNVSAKTGDNLAALVEAVLLQAEMMELKAPKEGPMEATVVEARNQVGHGPVATVLVGRGTLRKGAFVVVGSVRGRVRALTDTDGNAVEEATPAQPVVVAGLRRVPVAGDDLVEVVSDTAARKLSGTRAHFERLHGGGIGGGIGYGVKTSSNVKWYRSRRSEGLHRFNVMERAEEEGAVEAPIIVKADVNGVLEAILQELHKLEMDDVLKVIGSGLGEVTDRDLDMARMANATIITFNTPMAEATRRKAEEAKVPVKSLNIIYELITSVKGFIEDRLPRVPDIEVRGQADVLDTFTLSGRKRAVTTAMVAGCRVVEGTLSKGDRFRVLRNGKEIYSGPVDEIREVKEVVSKVVRGKECGLKFGPDVAIEKGDKIESFIKKERKQTIEEWKKQQQVEAAETRKSQRANRHQRPPQDGGKLVFNT